MDDVKELSFEEARDELREVIRILESGSALLEETLTLWQKGEALASHCRSILDSALKQVETATTQPEDTPDPVE